MKKKNNLQYIESRAESDTREFLKEIEERLAEKTYDFADSKTSEKIRQDFIRQMNEYISIIRGRNKNHEYEKLMDTAPYHLERMAAAIAEYAPEVYKRYKDRYPELDPVEEFERYNTGGIIKSYELFNKSEYFDYAAAIWILDELDLSFSLRRAMDFFPDEDKTDSIDSPKYFDSCHEERAIKSMMYIIKNRNSGENKEVRDAFFVDDVTAHNTKSREYKYTEPGKDITDRQRFDSIISMIRPKVKERAGARLEEKVWAALDIFMECSAVYQGKRKELLKKLRKNELELLDLFDERKKKINQLKVVSALANPYANINPGGFDSTKERFDLKVRMILENSMKIEGELDKISTNLHWLHLVASDTDIGFETKGEDREEAEELLENIRSFEVQNPFETCFALLYLLDNGSMIPWLYGQGMCILQAVARQLPWAGEDDDYDELFAEYLEEYSAETEIWSLILDEGDAAFIDGGDDKDELPDSGPRDWIGEEAKLYTRVYNNQWNWPGNEIPEDKMKKMNLAQIIFQTTDVIMPRNVFYEMDSAQEYEKSGFAPGQGKPMEWLVQLGRSVRERDYYSRRFDYGEIAAEEKKSRETEFEAIDESRENLRKKYEQLKETYHETHDERNKLARKAAALSAENQELKKELGELRELLKENRAVPYTVKVPDQDFANIKFPYTLKRRHVIFGGHDSWAKMVRPLINNARFIDPNMKPDPSLMIHADIIWIQNNAISHSDYYKVVNFARTHDIPVEYFAYSSAEKCARQLAEYDMGLSLD